MQRLAAGGHMELPDFDTLRRLAVAEPERLDELLRQQIEGLIDRVSPEQQQRLRGLQFRIDCQRQLAKNNMDSCIRIAAMMHDSFYSMRSEMIQLNANLYADQAPVYRENNVVSFFDYYHKKK
ncbi:conserved hypothetical protein [Aeromonas salmonicida subsp. salmonicida A449]|jgi:hypothetical protein|uniref:DUF3135 domain-containing protein n=4 Tax=Bacteria TaxID=2 RepID=A4SJJ0_AERS4|nr:conserved hypothetical protein [Aeromonas salmonicida subsp. salmonicida A449]EHI51536.1 hypothetical protein IYQ_15868 [Aeromonas salmonicida subsp. salmonicida 01-B526]QHU94845.1 DUF3135 domain-containing protein [Aeromonas salmonicida subsp. salmonicida]QYH25016.1 DUF3135 domain-containing protein [Aeromonas salmonicida subsp. masoucida]QJF54532.1 DUF3135 domain-containing protein [Aeromonas salmonicida subsp. salmonicida]